jgi:hypothetical protein
VAEGITCVMSVLRESSNRICNSSKRLGIIGDFRATLLQHLLVLKGVAEMELDTGILYQCINIFELFGAMFLHVKFPQ